MSSPTMVSITQALANLYANAPSAPVTRWEVYPSEEEETAEGAAHLYADLLAAPSQMASAVTEWARLLGVQVHTKDTGGAMVRLTATATLPGGVRLAISQPVPAETLPADLQSACASADALF